MHAENGEMASALITVLAAALAMSPTAVRSPTAMRHTCEEIGKRLRSRVAAAERNPDVGIPGNRNTGVGLKFPLQPAGASNPSGTSRRPGPLRGPGGPGG